MNLRSPVSLAWALSLAIFTLPAFAKVDLTRVAPVPADQPIPIQDFFRPRALAQPTINHAGTHIAAVVAADEDKHLLLVYDIATAKADTLSFLGAKDISNVYWLNDTRVLFQLSSRKMYGLGIMAADIANLSAAYPLQQFNGSSLVSMPRKKTDEPLVWNRYDIETRRDEGVVALNSRRNKLPIIDLTNAMSSYDLMQVYSQVQTSNSRTIVRSYPAPTGAGIVYRYMADKEGELAYAFSSSNGNLSMHRLEDGKWKACPVDLESIDIVTSANEPGQLLVIGPAKEAKPHPLQLMTAASGELGEVVLQDQHYDFNGWTYNNPASGSVLGAVFQKGWPRVYWFTEEYQALQKILEGMLPKQVVLIIGSDDKHEMFLVVTYSDRQPGVYHWVNLATRQAGIFKNSAPWIDSTRMQPMQVVQFKTRDGYRLEGYLTLPAGTSKENPAPLVVLCHGGPWARDNWGFNGEVQFLASRGYAVLQPNYRGSTGSVGRFPAADKYDFIKMHHDVTDAVKTMIGTGLIDQTRIGIMGGSFGGYLAVSGVAHEPDLYRCAVTNAGVFDWALQVQSEKYDQYNLPYYGHLVKHLGDPKKETAKYEAMSPLKHVANIRVPVFVAGGKDDQTVEINQSRALIGALEKHGVPHETLLVGDEGHGMAHLENQVELYGRIEAFFAKNLMPKK